MSVFSLNLLTVLQSCPAFEYVTEWCFFALTGLVLLHVYKVGYKSKVGSDPPIIFLPIINFIFAIISKLWFKCPVYQFYIIIIVDLAWIYPTCIQQRGIQNKTNGNIKTTHTAVSFLGQKKSRYWVIFMISCLSVLWLFIRGWYFREKWYSYRIPRTDFDDLNSILFVLDLILRLYCQSCEILKI